MLLFLACSGVSLSILNFQCYPKSDYAEKRRSPLFSNHASFFPCRNPRVFVNSPNPPHPALAVASLHSSRLEVGVNVSSYSGTLSYHSIRGSDDSLYDSSIVQTNRDGSASSRNKRSSPARVLMIMDCECRHRLLIGRSKRNRMSPYLILYGLAKFETQDRWSKSQIDFFNEVDNFPLQIEFDNSDGRSGSHGNASPPVQTKEIGPTPPRRVRRAFWSQSLLIPCVLVFFYSIHIWLVSQLIW